MISSLRGAVGRIFDPVAGGLLRMGVTADAVTVAGAFGVVVAALVFFPLGLLWVGALVIGVLAFSDALDGTMARKAGTSGPWGAFLDSTLDRVADGAIFIGLGGYFLVQTEGAVRTWGAIVAAACLVSGFTVSYARARAEGLGFSASVGIAERGERLVAALLTAGIVGFGLPPGVLVVVLGLLAVASVITVLQRMSTVRRQALARAAAMAAEAPTPGRQDLDG